MRLCRFRSRGETWVGAVRGDGLHALGRDVPWPWQLADRPTEFVVGLAATDLLAPLTPRRAFATGANYRTHIEEMGITAPAAPSAFFKLPPSVTGPGEIVLPSDSTAIDYEGEIALVIGRRAYRPTAEEARECVIGFTLANDVSARDLPMPQTILAKGSSGFCPLGPWLVTRDSLVSEEIKFTVELNGEVRQRGHVDDMIHGFDEIVHSLAAALPLMPGDVILTGTPSGVGVGSSPPRFLRDGDVVTVSSPQLGRLENRFVAPAT